MYGMVNRAIEGLITERFGVEAWKRDCFRTAIESPVFVSSDPYPDAFVVAWREREAGPL